MQSLDASAAAPTSSALIAPSGADAAPALRATAAAAPVIASDILKPDNVRGLEHFIPITTVALIDRLTAPGTWPKGMAKVSRRFFRYLDYWRRQQYSAELMELLQAYEPFSPDSDLLVTRRYSDDERRVLQTRVVEHVERILKQANYVRIDPAEAHLIMTKETHYGLDLHVDFTVFEDCLIYYRGASTRRDQRRTFRKFLRKEEFVVPIFQRVFLLFKLKPLAVRAREVMRDEKLSFREAEKLVRRARAHLSPEIKEGNIYLKLFKNIPRSDMEMVFPNTRVMFRLFDKLKLGVTAGGGLGMGAISAAGKIAVAASNPIVAAGAVLGLGGIVFRQAVNFLNQKQRYMVVMAQNLYFHSMADNRSALVKLADRAAEEDVKEEMLLYSVLAKEPAKRGDLADIDKAIERYLMASFGIAVDFDLDDALDRLMADGIVTEKPDGTLVTLPPGEAAEHLDGRWDVFLDNLPDIGHPEGEEFEGGTAVSA